MRVTILTQYYPPEVGAPQGRLSDLARRFVAQGHDVTVVTAMPNYPTGEVFDAFRGRVVAREDVDGVTVLRSWIWATKRNDRRSVLLSYFSFVLSATCTAPFRIRRSDVLIWESPPLFLAPVAWLLAKRSRAHLVMNVSDLWPRSAVDLGVLRSPRLIRLFELVERWAYRRAALVTCQTEGIRDGVADRASGTATWLLPNGVDLEHFRPVRRDPGVRARYGIPDEAVVVGYAGNFGRSQALHQVVEAAGQLRDRSDIWFLLVGGGPCAEDIRAAVEEHELDRVVLAAPVPRTQVPALQSAWDLSVVPLADAPVFEGARPSKMFELFSMGVPFIFCGRGEGAALATESGGALIVPPESPGELAASIERLADDPEVRRRMSEASRSFVAKRFDRRRIAADLEAELRQLVDRNAA